MRDGPVRPADGHVHSEWSWDAPAGSMERTCARAGGNAEPPPVRFRGAESTDAHLLSSYLRPTLPGRSGPDGRPSILVEHHRPLSAYLAAALPLGFQVRHCAEPGRPPATTESGPLPTGMSWDLLRWCPEAAAAAHHDAPVIVIWHFQLDGGPGQA